MLIMTTAIIIPIHGCVSEAEKHNDAGVELMHLFCSESINGVKPFWLP